MINPTRIHWIGVSFIANSGEVVVTAVEDGGEIRVGLDAMASNPLDCGHLGELFSTATVRPSTMTRLVPLPPRVAAWRNMYMLAAP